MALSLQLCTTNLVLNPLPQPTFEKFYLGYANTFALFPSTNIALITFFRGINAILATAPALRARITFRDFFPSPSGLFFLPSQLGNINSCISKLPGFSTTLRCATLVLFGVGFKSWRLRNFHCVAFDLGRSHYTLVPVPRFTSVDIRRRKNIRIFSCNFCTLQIFVKLLIGLRVPDPYKGKGVRRRGIVYRFKRGKKR